uniref:hypothetical chloroplast RF19 n=1 Tax=Sclerocactus unguispinus TaxID=1001094 RepID=UPI003001AC91|nr:hypothetical chloroplast RF19 [Sclerocactus unguispinus]WRY72302.1 hypothetical chloroplast RF19 [Sclerocactus unguispinus]
MFLINLLFQLLNHFFFPSSMLTRLVSIYMFRYNNKMLFVASSFVGWLIGQILFMKWVRFLLVWLQENYLIRAKIYIFSNKYLFYAFRIYRDALFDLRTSMNEFSSILVFFTCLCIFGRMPLPLLTHKIEPDILPKKEDVELKKTPEEEKEEKRIIEKYYGKDISNIEPPGEGRKIPLWFEKTSFIFLLFDYNRWNRPVRHIRNPKFEKAVRNEMSQFYFDTCPNDGKLRISFSCPPSLTLFWKMIQRKITFLKTSTTEDSIYDELYDYWIYTNENKFKSLRREFSKRIAVLDKKGLEKINVLENKIRLCKNKIQKRYLPFRHDPFLNGPHRGILKDKFIPHMVTLSKRKLSLINSKNPRVLFNEILLPIRKNRMPMVTIRRPRRRRNPPMAHRVKVRYGIENLKKIKNLIRINKIQILLSNDYNYYKSEQQIHRFYFKSPYLYLRYFLGYFLKDILIQQFITKKSLINSFERDQIIKKVPHWPYKLLYETEEKKIKEAKKKVEEEWKKAVGEEGEEEKEEEGKVKREEEIKIDIEAEADVREARVKRTLHFQTLDKDGDIAKQIILPHYLRGPQLGELIKGSVRAQKRKSGIWLLFQKGEHSPFYLSRTDSFPNRFVRLCYFLKGIFLKYMRKISEFELLAYYPSFEDLLYTIEDTATEDIIMDDEIEGAEKYADTHEQEQKAREVEVMWEDFVLGHIVRTWLLIIQSYIRRGIIIPLLIIVKNIGRMLLLQRPEFLEDLKDYEEERHFFCTYNGVPFSEKELPENWMYEGMQIKVIDPFRLKPWHRSRPSGRKRYNDFFYLTTFGLPTSIPYGPAEAPRIKPFLKPIFKKLYKISQKILKHFAKIKKKIIFFIQNLLFNLFTKNRLEKRLLKKNLSKENDSIINNQMIHESSIESQFKNLTNYSLTQRRMKDLANRRSTIRNKMDQISKIVNISPNKKHYGVKRLESLQNFVQILKRRTARLIRKSGYFIEFFMEKIYVDLFLYIFNISRIYTQKFFLELKTKSRVYIINRNTIQFISAIQKSHFLFSRLLSNKIKKNWRSHSDDLSFLSQAYVFYKISQAQLSNLYKFRSVFQYNGTSLFLKNEIKDYFGAQGIIHSELRTKKLPNSGMNRWKNWLKSNYQHGLSQKIWSELGIKKRRNTINKYLSKKKKWNSYEKEQLINSNYQNAKAPLFLLPDEQENWKKNLKFEVLSYKFLFHENKKDLYSYKIPFQGNKNKELSYTKNYNKCFDILNTKENMDRKFFDWKIIHFDLLKKSHIRAWIDIDITSNKNTKIEPMICQTFEKFYDDDLIFYEEEKEIDEKEKEIDEREKEIDEREKEIEEKEKELFFEDKKDQYCHQISKKEKEKFDQKIINRLNHQKENFFDWMGMNEEIVGPRPRLEFWFFPELVSLYNRYKKKPWTIPMDFLCSSYEDSIFNIRKKKKVKPKKTLADIKSKQKKLAEEKEKADQKKLAEQKKKADQKKLAEQKKTADQKKLAEQKKTADQKKLAEEKEKADQKKLAEQKKLEYEKKLAYEQKKIAKHIMPPSHIINHLKSYQKEESSVSINKNVVTVVPELLSCQMDLIPDEGDMLNNIHVFIMLENFKMKPKRKYNFVLALISVGQLNIDILMTKDVYPSLSNILKKGIFFIETIGVSDIEGLFLMYQMTGLSWVHKSRKHQNNQKRFGDENNYDLLIPENILLPRRRRELRILSLLNSRNNKGVDKNPVYCNGNRVNKGSHFFDKSKDLDRDKKKLIKFFLWPNYRLEDLACMNRYWFDTNNGSRFSILRIRMYP